MLYIKGRQFPVDRFYVNEKQEDYLDAALVACLKLHRELPEGDILCFLPGREDIEHVHRMVESRAAKFPADMMKVRHVLIGNICFFVFFFLTAIDMVRAGARVPYLCCVGVGGPEACLRACPARRAKADSGHQYSGNLHYHSSRPVHIIMRNYLAHVCAADM